MVDYPRDMPDPVYDPPEIYVPLNRYRYTLGWEWSDSSVYVKPKIKVGFGQGQQRWDADFGNTIEWLTFWKYRIAHYRRNARPDRAAPWYHPGWRLTILDANPENISPMPAGWSNTFLYEAPSERKPYVPEIGYEAYVFRDRMTVLFTANGWRPKARLVEPDCNFELAVFANWPVSGRPIVRHVVSQPFRLYAGNTKGRVRGWSYDYPPFPILKNGVEVASAYQAMFSSGINVPLTVDFQEGDVLEIVHPGRGSARRGINISIVGGFL